VVDNCIDADREKEFTAAREFLKTAIYAVKAKQSHYLLESSHLNSLQAYNGAQSAIGGSRWEMVG
jgi:hypothetical protein